jgi:hypothetical protein
MTAEADERCRPLSPQGSTAMCRRMLHANQLAERFNLLCSTNAMWPLLRLKLRVIATWCLSCHKQTEEVLLCVWSRQAALLGTAAVLPYLSAQVAAPGIPRGVPAQLMVHLHGALQHGSTAWQQQQQQPSVSGSRNADSSRSRRCSDTACMGC